MPVRTKCLLLLGSFQTFTDADPLKRALTFAANELRRICSGHPSAPPSQHHTARNCMWIREWAPYNLDAHEVSSLLLIHKLDVVYFYKQKKGSPETLWYRQLDY